MGKYKINFTDKTTYNDPVKGVINGVLVSYTMTDYNEVHEIRVPTMDANLIKSEIEKAITARDEIAALGS